MPRPKTKVELEQLSQQNSDKLMGLIEALDEAEQEKEFPPGTLNRNIRDILMHLHHWHLMMLGWYEVGMTGQKPEMPAPGYSWKMTPELNVWIQKQYTEVPLQEAKDQFFESQKQVFALIHQHSNEELFEKKRYKWTGTTFLGAYLISATSSHYDWALKLIKRVRKKAANPPSLPSLS